MSSPLPSGNWLLSTPALRRVVQHGGQDAELEKRFLPAARVLDAIPGDDRSTVLATDPDMPYVARFGRHGRVVNWSDPSLRAAALAADGDPSGRAWSALLRDVGPRWLLTRAEPGPALQAGMRLYGAAPVARCGDAGLWRKGAAGPIEKC